MNNNKPNDQIVKVYENLSQNYDSYAKYRQTHKQL